MTIDGRSNLYIASWLGGSFRYGGEDVGFIARLTPENADPEPVPDFESAGRDRLVDLLASPHSLYRFHAQRELLRRGPNAELAESLADLARSGGSIESRVAAMFTLKELEGAQARSTLAELAEDDDVREFALRALADRKAQNHSYGPRCQ